EPDFLRREALVPCQLQIQSVPRRNVRNRQETILVRRQSQRERPWMRLQLAEIDSVLVIGLRPLGENRNQKDIRLARRLTLNVDQPDANQLLRHKLQVDLRAAGVQIHGAPSQS